VLILTRRQEEAVAIGSNIQVKVVGIRRGFVRLGFIVPDDVVVLRTELLPQLKHQLRAIEQLQNLTAGRKLGG
jgi:carbon storage regulator CsrA